MKRKYQKHVGGDIRRAGRFHFCSAPIGACFSTYFFEFNMDDFDRTQSSRIHAMQKTKIQEIA